MLRVRPAGLSFEAANPRHAHEWTVFERTTLPDDKFLVPGVIDSTTNYIEHPELVAQRLRNYTRLVGPERVIAGTDCGFGTSVVRQWRWFPSITWAKLASMVEGARLASVGRREWRRVPILRAVRPTRHGFRGLGSLTLPFART